MRRRALRQLAAALTGALAFLSPAGGEEYRVLVCPAQFQNLEMQATEEDLQSMTSRAAEYLNDQFRGTKTFSFTLAPLTTLPETSAYYGADVSVEKDVRVPEALAYIIRNMSLSGNQEPPKEARSEGGEGKTDPDEPEAPGLVLSDFDNDGDGVVDIVCLLLAGPDGSRGGLPDDIWPRFRKLSLEGMNLSRYGLKIDSYTVCTEDCTFGVFCHELLHSFGLSDMYDTDGEGSGGIAPALWGTSIMDDSAHREEGGVPANLNALELLQLGLGQCDTLTVGEYRLSPVNESGRFLRYNTDVENEFFLFECRKAEGWDRHIGGSGMLVYHVDMSTNEAGFSDFYKVPLNAYERWKFNHVNSNPEHQCVDLIEADPETEDRARIFFPAGSTSFRAGGKPSFRFWSGRTADIAIENISLSGDGSISFTASTPLELDTLEIYQDAVTLRWTCSGLGECDVVLDGETVAEGIRPYRGSEYCFTIEGLEPKSRHTVRIESETNEISAEFSTTPFHRGSYPFIYLKNAERTPEGLFIKGSGLPLRVYNAPSRPVEWFFNGQPVRTGPDGRFRLETSGTLKAEVLFEDGSKDVITKKINVR